MEIPVDKALLGAVIAIVGWLLNRSIKGVDDKLARLDGKVDLLSKADGEHAGKLIELNVRVSQLEAAKERMEQHLEDFGGFLATQGFKRRDGG